MSTTCSGHRWFAAFYDLQSHMTERIIASWRRGLLAGLHGEVIEIGAGTGANFTYYPPDVRVVAFEPDPYMRRRAQRRLAKLSGSRIELRDAPAEALPCADASFDAAVSAFVLCTISDVPRALAELRRVLRAGGELRFIEHVRGNGLLGRVQDLVAPAWRWFAGGCEPNRRTAQALLDAGFEIVSMEQRRLELGIPAIVGVARAPSSVRVIIATTPRERDDAFAVRIAVFVGEQQIPREEELDELDAEAIHAVAYHDGTAVGAGRVVISDGFAKIGRMAVLAQYRGQRIGGRILEALEKAAADRGASGFTLSAQLRARRFYERAGYKATGGMYDEVGIPHIAMEKRM